MSAIHKLFKYDCVHTVTPLEVIFSELGNENGTRTMKDTPSQSNLCSGTANTIDDSVSRM